MESGVQILQKYYDCFNKKDVQGLLSLLDQDVLHSVNQGSVEVGVQAFSSFLERMNRSYEENITQLVIMSNSEGTRLAAEFVVEGKYLSTDKGLPDAKGQTYSLLIGAFFEVKNGKITRVTNYYNMQDWLKQVEV